MLSPKLYNTTNVERLKYVQIGLVALAAVVCAYLTISTVMSVGEVRSARSMLEREKNNVSKEALEFKVQEQNEAMRTPPGNGGVDAFAVEMVDWAKSRDIRVESFVPEGTPMPTEISNGNTKLGFWNASKVRVLGHGQFVQLMDLLRCFREAEVPVQMESFSLESGSSGKGIVSFSLLLTVYEKKSGTS